MCFERTDKKVEPFHVGYRAVDKKGERYTSLWQGDFFSYPKNEWLDEMPYRVEPLLLEMKPKFNVGWHVFSTLRQAEEWKATGQIIVRVECYGLDEPYGLGLAYGKPAGRFQFMKILEEVA